MKKIIVTGLTGQDAPYMAEYCLNLGHEVYGMVRLTSGVNNKNYAHLENHPLFHKVKGDLLDSTSLDTLLRAIQPDYFINFAAQSFVGDSWTIPEQTFMTDAVGVLKCLEAVRKEAPHCRFYNAGSSEQFGDVDYSPQDEKHPFKPRSPYGAAKASAHHLVKVYRESYGLYAVQGILFNHESERRGIQFVTRKITKGVARIYNDRVVNPNITPIELGNINAKRDWSHAEDMVDGVWRMINQEQYRDDLKDIIDDKDIVPRLKDYILSSQETHTIREFIEKAFDAAGIKGDWVPQDIFFNPKDQTHGCEAFALADDPTKLLVTINPKFYRPADVELLLGDSTAARIELKWRPKISFDNLVKRMVDWDINEEVTRT